MVWKRSARLSDVTVHSSQFQRVEGQTYRRWLLPADRHPGFKPNATYHVSYVPDNPSANPASTAPIRGTLQFLMKPED